jgi:hypothetical protein
MKMVSKLLKVWREAYRKLDSSLEKKRKAPKKYI